MSSAKSWNGIEIRPPYEKIDTGCWRRHWLAGHAVLRQYSVPGNGLTFITMYSKNRGSCEPSSCSCFVSPDSSSAVTAAVAVENAALRLQLAAFQRKRRRLVLTSLERLFWVGLSLLWKHWRSPLIYVRADTVVRWQRERLRRFWAGLSRRNQRRRGRPATAVEIRRLIAGTAAANLLWRAPRIHGELKMLRIEISERTVSRLLRKLPRRPGQSWKTFLHNHLSRWTSSPCPRSR
jgi:hypothetical protein